MESEPPRDAGPRVWQTTGLAGWRGRAGTILGAVAFALISVVGAAGAADVTMDIRSHDQGGGTSVSAGYRIDQTLGEPGGFLAASGGEPGATVSMRTGFAGQINDPPGPVSRVLERRPGAALKFLRSLLVQGAVDAEADAFVLEPLPVLTPAGANLVVEGPWVFYLPPPGDEDDAVPFVLKDALGGAATGTVTIRVADPAGLTRNLLSIEVLAGGAGTRIRWVGIPGRFYRVQSAESLAEPVAWKTVGSIQAGPNGAYEFVDPSNLAGLRFYRAVTP